MNNDTWHTLKDYQWESRLTNKDRESETGYFVDSSFRFKCNFKQPISAFLVDSLKTPDNKEKSFLRWDVKNEYQAKKHVKDFAMMAFGFLFNMPQNRRYSISVFFLFENWSRVFFLKCLTFNLQHIICSKNFNAVCSYLILKIGQMGPRKIPK